MLPLLSCEGGEAKRVFLFHCLPFALTLFLLGGGGKGGEGNMVRREGKVIYVYKYTHTYMRTHTDSHSHFIANTT